MNTSNADEFDLIVIGSGSGATVSAAAAAAGWKVAVIDSGPFVHPWRRRIDAHPGGRQR